MTSPDNVTRDVLKVVIAFFKIDCATFAQKGWLAIMPA